MDTVVVTWALCSIPDVRRALSDMRRVLRPEGHLLFVEHGLAPDPPVARWQHRLDPLWTRVSCHLDRPMDALIAEAGFRMTDLQTGYLGQGPKLATFMYMGRAVPIPEVA
jgi:SAM-dependent methyltransferase